MRIVHLKKILASTALSVVFIAANVSLVACSGGSKSDSTSSHHGSSDHSTPPTVNPSPPPAPTPLTTVWEKDYYLPRNFYKDRCQFPRAEQHPITNAPFPDQNGTMLDELYYLRSLTHETYLWRSDLTDMDPAKYNKVKSTFSAHYTEMVKYFNELKTKEITASGKPKDNYHYTQLTSERLSYTSNKPLPSYGINWVVVSGYETVDGRRRWKLPRDLRVRYVEPGSPAAEKKVKRGDKVLKVNGVDFLKGESTELNAVFGTSTSKTTSITFEDVDTKQEKTLVLLAKNIRRNPVNKTSILEAGEDKVGYIHYVTFNTTDSDSAVHQAIKTLKAAKVKDLVLDLRYNSGGYLYISSMLAYMVAGASKTKDKDYSGYRFRDGAGNINPVTGYYDPPLKFLSEGYGPPFSIPEATKLESLDLNRVFILTTADTCSASEDVINGLIGIDFEVILIGGTTCGKPYGFYPEDNCGITYSTVQIQTINHKKFGEYADGFVPTNTATTNGAKVKGCQVADDFSKQLGDKNEALLAAALQYRKDGTCPKLPAPPSPPSAIDVIASNNLRAKQSSPISELSIPDEIYREDGRIFLPND